MLPSMVPSSVPTPSSLLVRTSVTLFGIVVGGRQEQREMFQVLTNDFLNENVPDLKKMGIFETEDLTRGGSGDDHDHDVESLHGDDDDAGIPNVGSSGGGEEESPYSVEILNVSLIAQTLNGETIFLDPSFAPENIPIPINNNNDDEDRDTPSNSTTVANLGDVVIGDDMLISVRQSTSTSTSTIDITNISPTSSEYEQANKVVFHVLYSVTPYNPPDDFHYEAAALWGFAHNMTGYQAILFDDASHGGLLVAGLNDEENFGDDDNDGSSANLELSAVNVIMFVAIVCAMIAIAVYYYERKKTKEMRRSSALEREQEIARNASSDDFGQQHDMTFSREQFSPDSFNEPGGWRPREEEAWEGNGPTMTFTRTFSNDADQLNGRTIAD